MQKNITNRNSMYVAANTTTTQYWIGLRAARGESAKWVNGDPLLAEQERFAPSNVFSVNGSQDICFVETESNWTLQLCSNSEAFICQRRAKTLGKMTFIMFHRNNRIFIKV